MKKITFTPIFNLKKTLNKNGEAVITVKAYQDGRSKYFSTHLYVKPNQWDKRRLVIKNHPNEDTYNDKIRELTDEYKALQTDIINEKGYCILDDWLEYSQEKRFPCFLEFMEYELNNDAKIRTSTKITRRATFNKLKDYRQRILFRQLTYSFIADFDNWLHKSKFSKTTIAKHHKIIRFFLKKAINKNYLKAKKNPYNDFRYDRGKSKPRIFLTVSEIKRIEGLLFESFEDSLELVRDFFLLGCYTGLRFSDLSQLAKEHILQLDKGLEFVFNIKKSNQGKQLSLPLHKLFPTEARQPTKPEKIILKYLDHHKKIYNGHPFYDEKAFLKEFTNQYFNRLLKELMERAKVSKKIGSHNARHTFGVHMALKVSPFVLKELMGHSKMETTMVYVNLSRQLIDNELDKIDW